METFTARATRKLPANGRSIVDRLHLLLAETGVELPGTRFNIVHFSKPGTHGEAVINAPILHKERARVWFDHLAPLLPWFCTMSLDEQRGTITITDPKEAA